MPTPLAHALSLQQKLGLTVDLYLKREDTHQYGSHKGRSIPTLIAHYAELGSRNFVISSSGNAALAALLYIQEHNQTNSHETYNLKILVGEHINPEKLTRLKEALHDNRITINQVPNPKQAAFLTEQNKEATLLRQSTDDLAILGYADLADELAHECPDLTAIFVPTSSGTTAVGLWQGFLQLGINPEINIVQTPNVHPFVQTGDTAPKDLAPSLADAIVDKVGLRAKTIAEVLKNSHGQGYLATNNEISEMLELAKQSLDFNLSPNSALSLVGLAQAIKAGKTWSGPVVCLITGK